MNIDDLKKIFDPEVVDDCVFMNPLIVAEQQEFNRKVRPTMGFLARQADYRSRAIDFVEQNQLPFQSTENCVFDLAQRHIQIKCPYCNHKMEYHSGGGSGHGCSINFRCEYCDAGSTIEMRWNGLRFDPPVKKVTK